MLGRLQPDPALLVQRMDGVHSSLGNTHPSLDGTRPPKSGTHVLVRMSPSPVPHQHLHQAVQAWHQHPGPSRRANPSPHSPHHSHFSIYSQGCPLLQPLQSQGPAPYLPLPRGSCWKHRGAASPPQSMLVSHLSMQHAHSTHRAVVGEQWAGAREGDGYCTGTKLDPNWVLPAGRRAAG